MAAKNFKIIVESIEVLDDSSLVGPGEWVFEGHIVRRPSNQRINLGKSDPFEARAAGDTFSPGWQESIKVTKDDTKYEVNLSGTDESASPAADLGKDKLVMNNPLNHAFDLKLHSSSKAFVARIRVEIDGFFAKLFGFTAPVVRGHAKSSDFSTLHHEVFSKMVHVHPFIPVPWTTGITAKPPGVKTFSPQQNLGMAATDTKLNAMVNPAVIPAISPSDPDFADKVARIYITQYGPFDPSNAANSLDLNKVVWKAATDNIKLYTGKASVGEIKGGREIKAYGVLSGDADEQGKIELRYDSPGNPLLATFVCWVGKPKYIITRVNIIKTTKVGSLNPSVTPAAIKSIITYSNVLLWQAGILMVMDNDDTAYNGAVKKDVGIFEVTSASDYTFNVVKNGSMVAPILNQRSGVFNVACLHSCAGKPNLLGSAVDRRLSVAEADVKLKVSPSDSWVQPTGVFPDEEAVEVTMLRMGPSAKRADGQKNLAGDGNLDTVCACIVTDNGAQAGVNTLAHELGHVIGLHHRGNGGNQTAAEGSTDKVNHQAGPNKGHGHPFHENLMCYGSNTVRQDLDMLQASVARSHKLLTDKLPAPKPVPKEPLPAPTAYHPAKEDCILLQEYLSGKRAGLQHTNYDLGDYGPDGDGVDGIVGNKTKQAIKDFQRDHGEGLAVDGIYGPKTREAFLAELNPPD
ncbi:MAG: peptidoglycan-binding protein [Methylotetracoccus sp.]|nr:peptidoglycan-binding protein [Methylotetracoccus sp.]